MTAEYKPAEEIQLEPDETVEDLQRCGMRLLQKKQGFRFGQDSVLLAAYAAAFAASGVRSARRRPVTDPPLRIADLGAGCGAISLLLAARLPAAQLVGLELDPASCGALRRNILLNRLSDRLQAVEGDICRLAAGDQVDHSLQPHTFDLVVCNPPYRLPDRSWPASRPATEELSVTLAELLRAVWQLLKPGGRLVLVHQAQRLPDVLCLARQNHLEPKSLRLIQSLPDRAPETFLFSAVSQGRPGGFLTDKPLLVCSQPGVLSPEVAAWYGREKPLTPEALFRGIRRSADLMPADMDQGGTVHA